MVFILQLAYYGLTMVKLLLMKLYCSSKGESFCRECCASLSDAYKLLSKSDEDLD